MSHPRPKLSEPPKAGAAPPPPKPQILQLGLKFPGVPVANTVPEADRK